MDLIPAPAHHGGSLPHFMRMLLATVTCGADYACASSTETVVADAVCGSGACTDDDCCEPGEHILAASAIERLGPMFLVAMITLSVPDSGFGRVVRPCCLGSGLGLRAL